MTLFSFDFGMGLNTFTPSFFFCSSDDDVPFATLQITKILCWNKLH